MKITKKITHDKIWIKFSDGKDFTKLSIGRSGVKASSRGENETLPSAGVLFANYKLLYNNKLNYGEIINEIEVKFN
jgi:hypothetical protein